MSAPQAPLKGPHDQPDHFTADDLRHARRQAWAAGEIAKCRSVHDSFFDEQAAWARRVVRLIEREVRQ